MAVGVGVLVLVGAEVGVPVRVVVGMGVCVFVGEGVIGVLVEVEDSKIGGRGITGLALTVALT